MFAILHGWRLEGMAASIHETCGKTQSRRSELARDEPESAAGCQAASVIVDDHRERARSYSWLRFRARWRPIADIRRYGRLALLAMGWQRYIGPSLSDRPRDATPGQNNLFAIASRDSLSPC